MSSIRRSLGFVAAIVALATVALPAGPAVAAPKPIAPPFDSAEPVIVHWVGCSPETCTGTISADLTGASSMHLVNQTSLGMVPRDLDQFGAAQVFVTHNLRRPARSIRYRLVYHLNGLTATADPDLLADFESVIELDVRLADGGCCEASKVAHIFDHQPSGSLGAQDVVIDLDWPDPGITLEPGPIGLRVLLFGDVTTKGGLGGRATLDVSGYVVSLTAEITT